MTTLLLRLAGPLQSWGDSSRFVRRQTRPEPTKSGVIGMLAAAQGRRRADPLEDLLGLKFGVRVDQPGRLVRDFHTVHLRDGRSAPLTYRFYLADAVFLAGVEGEAALLEGLDAALRGPQWPLYLGRRSCPPAGPVALGVRGEGLGAALSTEPWQASVWWRRRQPDVVRLDVVRDAFDAQEGGDVVRDEPISFDPVRREYGWRTVVQDDQVEVANPDARRPMAGAGAGDRIHEPFDALGGL